MNSVSRITLTIMTLLGGASFAEAATTGTTGATQVAAASGAGGLEEIVVTAQKRRENLQNVPISVHALSTAALAANGVASTRDLENVVSTLVYSQGGSYGLPYLRGIGTDITLPNADPSVATYVDGVYVSSNSAIVQDLLGIQNVEVLEGPQGTLYGRNAVGGAINIYTLTPSQKLEGELSATIGNYDQMKYYGYVSGGVTSKVALGVYAQFSSQDTYYTRAQGDRNGPNGDQDWGVRTKAVFTPTDTLKFTASFEHLDSGGIDEAAFRNIEPNAPSYTVFHATPIIAPYTLSSGFYQVNDHIENNATLREDADFGWATLLGVTAYRDITLGPTLDDLSGSNVPLLAADSTSYSEQYSQELQLLSPASSAVKWIGGLFYFHERTGFSPQDTAGLLVSPVFDVLNYGNVLLNSYSAFGQATFPLDTIYHGLDFTVGGRYTLDKKRFDAAQQLGTPQYVPIPGTYTGYPTLSKKWGLFTPKLELDDHITSHSMIYASYSKGFKSGAYDVDVAATPGPVAPEKLNAYEIGTKNEFFDGRLRWNASAYYYDQSNIQVQVLIGGNTLLENAANAHLYGVENDLFASVTSALKLHASVAWEHSSYTSFPNAATYLLPFTPGNPTPFNAASTVNATGKETERAPHWVGSLGATYVYPLPFGGTIKATADWRYTGKFYWDTANSFNQRPYSIVNMTLGYTLPDDRTTVTAWVRNLTDAYYQNFVIADPVAVLTGDGEPRTFGVTATYRF